MKIDKKLFDKEYSTNYLKEFRYLEKNGIRPSFVKEIDGVSIFKYEKNSKLFNVLKEFYK